MKEIRIKIIISEKKILRIIHISFRKKNILFKIVLI